MNYLLLAIFVFVNGFSFAQENQIAGTWKLTEIRKGEELKEVDSGYIFEEGGVLKLGFFNMEEIIEAGTWKYNKADNAIEMISDIDGSCNGKAKILKLSANKMVYEKDAIEYHFTRESENSAGLTVLEFSETDFFTEEGDYKYDGEEEKLPWQDIAVMVRNLEEVSSLVYDYSEWNETTKSFEKKQLTADVAANTEEMTLGIDYIFYGYDKYNLPEDAELPSNNDYSLALYPEQESNFRITGTEEFTTLAGSFTCTVIEAVNAETKKKLWMINDQPGIYAKIIIEKPGMFGAFYHGVFELNNIQERF